jgi:Fe-S-cluster-containing hydrogenase component 2
MHDSSERQNDVNGVSGSGVVDAHPALVELARTFGSVKIMGPPMSAKLVELIAHLYSIEEAEVCRGLSFLYPRSAETVARICKRDPLEVLVLLQSMAQRRVIHAAGNKFLLYPLIPGIFEYVFMTGQDTPWHARYAKLVNELFGTGYIGEYLTREIGAIRNIPIQAAIDGTNYVVDSDLMSRMLNAHDRFAVLHYCPCRHSKRLLGRHCQRATPEEGCLVFGNFSSATVANGNGRSVSRAEMSHVVAERQRKKLVFLTANVDPAAQNVVCTCCDCCCHALETANHYSRKFIAPAHYIAEVDDSSCNNCRRCLHACNTHAHMVEEGKHLLLTDRCIGCGYCVDACKAGAIRRVENRSFQKPAKGYLELLLRMMPSIAMMGLKIKWTRHFGKTEHRLLDSCRGGDQASLGGDRKTLPQLPGRVG